MLPWKDKDQKLLPWKQFGQVAAASAGESFVAAAGGAILSSCKESWGVGVQGAPTSRLEFFLCALLQNSRAGAAQLEGFATPR